MTGPDGMGFIWYTPINAAPSLTGAAMQIAKGGPAYQTCALTQDRKAWCWGSSFLGDGSASSSAHPSLVAGQGTFGKLANQSGSQGTSTNCGLKDDRSVWCWGINFAGEIGDGTTDLQKVPVRAASTAGSIDRKSTRLNSSHVSI